MNAKRGKQMRAWRAIWREGTDEIAIAASSRGRVRGKLHRLFMQLQRQLETLEDAELAGVGFYQGDINTIDIPVKRAPEFDYLCADRAEGDELGALNISTQTWTGCYLEVYNNLHLKEAFWAINGRVDLDLAQPEILFPEPAHNH